MSNARLNITWSTVLVTSNIAIPTLLALLNGTWSLPSYIPRELINDNDLYPMLIALWSGPSSFASGLSRILQLFTLVAFTPIISAFYQSTYLVWVYLALARALAGFVLSRAVGWAAPRFFKHWALYEPTSGFGSVFFSLSLLHSTGTLDLSQYVLSAHESRFTRILSKLSTRRHGYLSLTLGLGAVLCWLENAPWTYGIALIATFAIVLASRILAFVLSATLTKHSQYSALDPHGRADTEMAVIGEPHSYEQPSAFMPSLRGCIVLGLVALALMEAPFGILPRIFPHPLTPMPPAPSPPAPLLEILMLTYPRSDLDASTSIMKTTLDSYLPLLTGSVRLSVFTHAREHRAFDLLKQQFSSNITFYADGDSHPESDDGHYLHLAEAFRWVSEPRQNMHQAEWVMLIEDDFPLCAGETGRDALNQVLTLLEASRPHANRNDLYPQPHRRAGFIGTGGSGLIIHKTMLPILHVILRIHAEKANKLPAALPRRAPDQVVQDCILGRDPMCPVTKGRACVDQDGKASNCGLVITSRLIMDHIGGMYSTTWGKAKNSDKWRCGWRHPFHGTKDIEIVVVDW